MIFFTSFLLGATFGSAGLIAKQINSMAGMRIANRRVHNYMTLLGALSNLILPIIAILIASIAQGIGGGVMALLGMVIGAILLGMLRLPYYFKMMLAFFGVPLSGAIFLISL